MSAGDQEVAIPYSAELLVPLRHRLHDDWADLASVVGMPAHDQRRLTPGEEAIGIWHWLDVRGQLAVLPRALRDIGREDLAVLFETTPSFGSPATVAAVSDSASRGLSATTRVWLNRVRFSALSAKHLHAGRRARLNRWLMIVDFAVIVVLLFAFPVRYFNATGVAEQVSESVWPVLAGAVLFLIVVKNLAGWPHRFARYDHLQRENGQVASEVDELLRRGDSVSASAPGLRATVDRLDAEDQDVLGPLRERERQRAYREALKEAYPGQTATCGDCGASPWHRPPRFARGSCRVCGNTPPSTRTTETSGEESPA